MLEFQIYFIACVFYKITFKLDSRGRDVRVHTMKTCMGKKYTNPLIHYIIIKWRLLVSLMLWPIYSHINSHLCELIVGCVGPRINLDI